MYNLKGHQSMAASALQDASYPSPASKRKSVSRSASRSIQNSGRSGRQVAPNAVAAAAAGPGFKVPYHSDPSKAAAQDAREARAAARRHSAAGHTASAPSAAGAAQLADTPQAVARQTDAQHALAQQGDVSAAPEPFQPMPSGKIKRRKKTSRKPAVGAEHTKAAAGTSHAAVDSADASPGISPSCARTMTFGQWKALDGRPALNGTSSAYVVEFAANAAAKAASVVPYRELDSAGSLDFTQSRASTQGDGAGPLSDVQNAASIPAEDGLQLPASDDAPTSMRPEGNAAHGSTSDADITRNTAQQNAFSANEHPDPMADTQPWPEAHALQDTAAAVDELHAAGAQMQLNAAHAEDDTTDDEGPQSMIVASTAAQDTLAPPDGESVLADGTAVGLTGRSVTVPGPSIKTPPVCRANAAQHSGKRSRLGNNSLRDIPIAPPVAEKSKSKRKKVAHAQTAAASEHAQPGQPAAGPSSERQGRKDKKRKKDKKKMRALAKLQGEPAKAPSGLDVLAEQASLQQDADNAGPPPAEGTSEGPHEDAATSPVHISIVPRHVGGPGDGQPMGASAPTHQSGGPSEAGSVGGAGQASEEQSRKAGPSSRRGSKCKSALRPPFVEYRHYADGRKYQAR